MDRRRFLLAMGAAAAGPTAGCVGGSDGTATPQSERSTEPATDTRERARPLAEHGRPPDICREAVRADPGIYAVVDPAFGPDWDAVDPDRVYLPDNGVSGLLSEQTVIGVETEDGGRAYPLSVLWHHEIVNDTVGGTPVLVTYCPLCRSGMVARRVVDGDPTRFLVSGLLWKPPRVYSAASEAEDRVFGAEATGGETTAVRNAGNLVMYDGATGSYWSQLLVRAICGPEQGETLDVLPSTVTTWGEWREAHPDTGVLLPPPRSGTVDPGRATPSPPG